MLIVPWLFTPFLVFCILPCSRSFENYLVQFSGTIIYSPTIMGNQYQNYSYAFKQINGMVSVSNSCVIMHSITLPLI